MNKKLIALLLIIITLLTGCMAVETSYEEVDKKEFEILSEEGLYNDNFNDNLTIVRHKETGKRFVIYSGARKGGIAPLD